jgi:DNA-binding NarL/FixJ family response regulator
MSVSPAPASLEAMHTPLDSDQLKEWVQESEVICQDLSRNLEEKKEITKRLIAQLDERVQTLQTLLKKMDEEGAFPSQEKIVEMAEAGCGISEIARQLRLPQGEIQLTLDLQKYRQSSS